MIVTEEEAKTKRCQESFSNAYMSPNGATMMAQPSSYMGVVQSSPTNCIGSNCMAWRWAELAGDDEHLLAGLCYKYIEQQESPGDKWELCTDPEEMGEPGKNVWRLKEVPRGYCGKAGVP